MKKELPRYPVIDIAETGRNIRRLRLEKSYTVEEMQTYLGLGCPQGIYHWQAGRSLPHRQPLRHFAAMGREHERHSRREEKRITKDCKTQ